MVSDYAPTGDQPEAIAQLLASIRHGSKHNTLLGVTGSGKTFTVANVISQLNRPSLRYWEKMSFEMFRKKIAGWESPTKVYLSI